MYKFPEGETHFINWEKQQKSPYQIKNLLRGLPFCKRFNLAVDIGAHVGLMTVPLSKLFRYVHAYEPSLINYACLKENLELHGSDNVKTANLAFSNYNGLGRLKLLKHSGGNFLDDEGEQKINVFKFDDIYKTTAIDFIKLDTQNTEYLILQGMSEYLKNFNPLLMVESVGEDYRNTIIRYLRKLEYKYLGAYKKDAFFRK